MGFGDTLAFEIFFLLDEYKYYQQYLFQEKKNLKTWCISINRPKVRFFT